MAGAQYLPLKITDNNKSPLPQLLQAVQSLVPQKNSNFINYEQLLSDVATAVVPKAENKDNKKDISASSITIKHAPPMPKQSISAAVWLLGILIFAALIVAYYHYQRSTEGIGLKKRFYSKLFSQLKSALSPWLRKRVRDILNKASLLKNRHLKINTSAHTDKKIELRINVPKGALEVYWINENGQEAKADALDISMHGIRFENRNFNATSITKITCDKLQLTLNITHSLIIKRNTSDIVALLEKFENNAKDWMKWVELLTRINNA